MRVSRGFFAGRGGPVIAVSALVSKHRDAGRVSWRNGGADPSAPPPMPQPNRLSGRSTHSAAIRSEEHTSELQSLMRISYAVFCLNKKNTFTHTSEHTTHR